MKLLPGKLWLVLIINLLFVTAAYSIWVFDYKNNKVLESLPMRLEEDLTFKVYYGSLDEQILQDLARNNMVILEPAQVSDEDLFTLQAAGAKVVGYLSLLEVGKWDKDLLDKLTSEDILVQETEEKGPIANLLSAHYQTIWLEAFEERIQNRGFDGVFLDTVDDLQLLDQSQREVQIQAAVEWMANLKATAPELLMLQNRGFDVFLQGSASFVDGLLWENFNATRMSSDANYAALVREVNEVSQRFGARIIGLNRLNNAENVAFYEDNQWLHAYLPWGTYSHYYFDERMMWNWIVKGIIDPEWVYSKDCWFVEEGALEQSVSQKAKELGLQIFRVLDLGALSESEAGADDWDEAEEKIRNATQAGYSGVLFDGTKDWYKISSTGGQTRAEVYAAYADFLRRMRQEFPGLRLYQHEGVMVVNPEAAPLLDGFVWTDFADSLLSDDAWHQQQVERLGLLAHANDWDVYIFSGDKVPEVRAYCEAHGYFYVK